jgi:hypothetical protein
MRFGGVDRGSARHLPARACRVVRYYFAGLYHSWHGSPSRQDSEVPLVVAHPRRSTAELAELTRRALGKTPGHADVAKLLLEVVVK